MNGVIHMLETRIEFLLKNNPPTGDEADRTTQAMVSELKRVLNFVKALQEVLSGLQKVVLGSANLQAALSDGGLPCTVSDLHERFDRYVAKLTKGKDASKVRIVIE